MAISIATEFPAKTKAPNANYPQGGPQDITTTGDGTGTPWNELTFGDLQGLLQGILLEAGTTPSGTPDTAIASQYFDGIKKLFTRQYVDLAAAVADTFLRVGQTIVLKDRILGNGGGGVWDVVLSSSVTENGFDIVQCTGVATLSIVLRVGTFVDANQFGADTFLDDNHDVLQRCINVAQVSGKNVIINKGSYFLKSTLHLPAHTSLIGAILQEVSFYKDNSTFTGDSIVRINDSDDGGSPDETSQYVGAEVKNISFYGDLSAGIAGIISLGSTTLNYLRFYDLDQSIIISNPLADAVKISDILVSAHDSSSYAIDITQVGSALNLDTLHIKSSPSSNFIKVLGCSSGKLTRCINGKILIQNCDAFTIENSHLEFGNITSTDSNIVIRDTAITGTENLPAIDIKRTQNSFKNYHDLSNITITWRPEIDPKLYFDIKITDLDFISIKNCYRSVLTTGAPTSPQVLGVEIADQLGAPVNSFNNRSHVLSTFCSINDLEVDTVQDQRTTNEVLALDSINIASGGWGIAIGTYYYTMATLYSKINSIGFEPSESEASISVATTAQSVIFNPDQKTPTTIRLYRGTSPGVYSDFVSIPAISCGKLIDNGVSVNGYEWKTWTGSVDTIVSDIVRLQSNGSRALMTGSIGSINNGLWSEGDKVEFVNLSAGNNIGSVNVGGGVWKSYGVIDV